MANRVKILQIPSSSDEEEIETPVQSQIEKTQRPNRFDSYTLKQNIFVNPEHEQNSVPHYQSPVNLPLSSQIKEVNVKTMEVPELSSIKEESENKEKASSTVRDIKNVLEMAFDDSSEEGQTELDMQEEMQKKEENEYVRSCEQIDKGKFTHQAIQRGKTLAATLIRIKSGLNFFLPQYDMNFQNDCRHIVSCKKLMGANSSFVFSLSKEDFSEESFMHCGKIKGNFIGDVFNIYSPFVTNEKKPKKKLLASCRFKDENESFSLPKTFQVLMLNEGQHYQSLNGIQNCDDEKSLFDIWNLGHNKEKILYFKSRRPEFCKRIGAFRLNFNGRVRVASVKNFILEDVKSGRQVLMFGKNGDHLFGIEISHPLTPFLGLAFCIPFFSSKMFCS